MKTPKMNYYEAFIPVTDELEAAVEEAFERGEREMKKRYKLMTLLSAAAALALVFAVGALAVDGLKPGTPDSVVYAAGSFAPTKTPGEKGHAETIYATPTPLPMATEEPYPDIIYATTTPLPMATQEEKTEIALRTYLDEMYAQFCAEKGAKRQAAALYQALAGLLSMDEYEEAIAREEVISGILTEILGMDADFIRENGMPEVIAACLDGGETAAEEMAEDEVVADAAAEAVLESAEEAPAQGDAAELAQENASLAESVQDERTMVTLTLASREAAQEGRGYYVVSQEGAIEEGGLLDAQQLRQLIEEYAPYGVTYDEAAGAWRWNGQLVRYFLDVLSSNGEEIDSGSFEGSLRSFKCARGSVDIRTVRDASDPDENGYGRLTGVETWTEGQDAPILEVRFQKTPEEK